MLSRNNPIPGVHKGTVRHTEVTKIEKLWHGLGHYSSYTLWPIWTSPLLDQIGPVGRFGESQAKNDQEECLMKTYSKKQKFLWPAKTVCYKKLNVWDGHRLSVTDTNCLWHTHMSGNSQGVKRPYLGHKFILCNTLLWVPGPILMAPDSFYLTNTSSQVTPHHQFGQIQNFYIFR